MRSYYNFVKFARGLRLAKIGWRNVLIADLGMQNELQKAGGTIHAAGYTRKQLGCIELIRVIKIHTGEPFIISEGFYRESRSMRVTAGFPIRIIAEMTF
jgi:hypothetical protein